MAQNTRFREIYASFSSFWGLDLKKNNNNFPHLLQNNPKNSYSLNQVLYFHVTLCSPSFSGRVFSAPSCRQLDSHRRCDATRRHRPVSKLLRLFKIRADCRRFSGHLSTDKTRQFHRVGVRGVNWTLRGSSHSDPKDYGNYIRIPQVQRNMRTSRAGLYVTLCHMSVTQPIRGSF